MECRRRTVSKLPSGRIRRAVMSSPPRTNVTLEEYFALDDASGVKLEYFAGQVYAMAGALEPRVIIAGNAFAALHEQLRGRRCRAYQSDLRVRTGGQLFTYPDLTVACEPVFLEASRRTLLNPSLIVEVLSEATEAYDRGAKFESYQTIESLADYLLIDSNRMHADLFVRQPNGRWGLTPVGKPEEVIEIPSCDCRLTMSALYENVEFPALARRIIRS
jgi:Uma2 family endonuclease